MDQLKPYLNHIGDCSAGDDPLDFSCICGLRNLYHKMEVSQEQMSRYVSIVRSVQRLALYGTDHVLGKENLNRAIQLARLL